MAKRSRKDDRKTVQLNVRTELLNVDDHDEKPEVAAYAFSSGGQLLDRTSIGAKGEAKLNIPETDNAQRVRVIVGPTVEEQDSSNILTELMRRGGEERIVQLDDDFQLEPAIPIIPEQWLCWLRGLCFVRGTLNKRVIYGGNPLDLPVCNATVEVYEVDPWPVIVPRLPDWIVERLRDIILEPIPLPDPIPEFEPPIPIPRPQPDPAPQPRPINVNTNLSTASRHNVAEPTIRTNIKPIVTTQTVETTHLQMAAATENTFQFRDTLTAYPELIRPILCLYFPFTVTKQLVATTTTDACGRFATSFSMGCSSDTPDLYFIAKQQILPAPFFPPTVIYEPKPVQCYTYWDYDCGKEVNLYTSHDLVHTCPPCPPVIAPNNWVLITAVGNYPTHLIQHDNSKDDYGRATEAKSGASVGSPFGGTLNFRLEFDSSLREHLGVEYYLMSWRKAGSTDKFKPMVKEVYRHFEYEDGPELIEDVYKIGPHPVGSGSESKKLFKIPPAVPPVPADATGGDSPIWLTPDNIEDLTNAKFDTETEVPASEAGHYEIKLELFDGDGNLVDIDDNSIKYRIPNVPELDGTIHTQNAATLGLVNDDAFIMQLHIDNNSCTSELFEPTLNGTGANSCGVLNYEEPKPPATTIPGTVEMTFTASHPNDFATYHFRLKRGVTTLTPPTISGDVASVPSPITQSVDSLLGGCPVAAFAEHLWVHATAFNGLSRLRKFDAPFQSLAFVLTPEEDEE